MTNHIHDILPLTETQVAELGAHRLYVQVVDVDGRELDILLPRRGRALVRKDNSELMILRWWGRIVLRMPILSVGPIHRR